MSEAETLDRYADRRRHFRRPVHRTAELTLRTGSRVYDCTVIDESDGGVQVDLGEAVELPDEVVIRFSDEASQLVRHCWSLGSKVGYQFIDPAVAEAARTQDVPPALTLEPVAAADFAAVTPAALGMHCAEMDFNFSAERIGVLLRDELENGLRAMAEMRGESVPDALMNFLGPRWRVFRQE